MAKRFSVLFALLAGSVAQAYTIRVRKAGKGPGGCHGHACDNLPGAKDPPPPPPDPWVYVAPTHPPTPVPTREQKLDFIIGTPPPLPPWAVPLTPGAAPKTSSLKDLPKMSPDDVKPRSAVPGPSSVPGYAAPDPWTPPEGWGEPEPLKVELGTIAEAQDANRKWHLVNVTAIEEEGVAFTVGAALGNHTSYEGKAFTNTTFNNTWQHVLYKYMRATPAPPAPPPPPTPAPLYFPIEPTKVFMNGTEQVINGTGHMEFLRAEDPPAEPAPPAAPAAGLLSIAYNRICRSLASVHEAIKQRAEDRTDTDEAAEAATKERKRNVLMRGVLTGAMMV